MTEVKELRRMLMGTPRMERYADEGVNPSGELRKALNLFQEGMSEPNVFGRFPQLKQELKDGKIVDPILIMADLSPFSSLVSAWEPEAITSFLQRYYAEIGNEILQCNGVVEKYIGDAVIAVFGVPFEERTTKEKVGEVVGLAQRLVRKIERVFGGEVTLKVAIAYGDCFCGYVGPDAHRELTIIGQPLTELFRLEENCPAGAIIMTQHLYDQQRKFMTIVPRGEASWQVVPRRLDLRGVGPTNVVVLNRL